jgi:hypothetical protein
MEIWRASATENTRALRFVIGPKNLKHYRPTLKVQDITKDGR